VRATCAGRERALSRAIASALNAKSPLTRFTQRPALPGRQDRHYAGRESREVNRTEILISQHPPPGISGAGLLRPSGCDSPRGSVGTGVSEGNRRASRGYRCSKPDRRKARDQSADSARRLSRDAFFHGSVTVCAPWHADNTDNTVAGCRARAGRREGDPRSAGRKRAKACWRVVR